MAVDFLHINDRLYQQSLDWLHNYINANCIVRGKLMKGKVLEYDVLLVLLSS